MEQNIPSQPTDWPVLIRSLLLFAVNAIVLLIILGSALSDLAQHGGLRGEAVIVRLIPALSMAAALTGGALAYLTMGLTPPERVRAVQHLSGFFFILAVALLLTKAFGPWFGLI